MNPEVTLMQLTGGYLLHVPRMDGEEEAIDSSIHMDLEDAIGHMRDYFIRCEQQDDTESLERHIL